MDHSDTLTDNYYCQANFSHVVFIMTSNAGVMRLAVYPYRITNQDHHMDASSLRKQCSTPKFKNSLDGIIKYLP